MTLHPIRALDHVIEEYRDYLMTEFRAKDPKLKAALERELDVKGFLSQEPFFQAHRPFKQGARWRDLPVDAQLAGVMEQRAGGERAYLHQSEAIKHLLGPGASPLVVTTGTGSGKTEAFLLPVIQNAIEDATAFERRSGLTAVLVYPMNALANDQRQRIESYLHDSGWDGAVTVAQYDRGTNQEERERLRKNPPHILLTNYMMLEYLLVRPADREAIFANHRCRFLVLDEVHTYRGTLGSNIALLVRRLRAHLEHAAQNWNVEVPGDNHSKRYPKFLTVGTSATIKSIGREGLSREEQIHLRDEAVQEFFSKLAGAEKVSIKVLGEELESIQTPWEATYPSTVVDINPKNIDVSNADSVRRAICKLAGQAPETTLEEAVRCCRLLWDLNRWLIATPLSISGIVAKLREVDQVRRTANEDDLGKEVEAALIAGAALPDGTTGVLRLRAHRFIRGGWQFHRCVNPACGKLYPMGEEQCSACGHKTAPLYLCRNCGADYLRFVEDKDNGSEDCKALTLRPSALPNERSEWLLYEPGRFDAVGEEIETDDTDAPSPESQGRGHRRPKQIRQRPVMSGSFDPKTLAFSPKAGDYKYRIMLVPARTQCLCCGGTAGSRNVITPVSLGTSAAVKVMGEGLVEALAEANRNHKDHDGKERLLVFSDSRQDASHQARFIIFASRYDRMRRRLMQLLEREATLTLQRTVEFLGDEGCREHDNPCAPDGDDVWLSDDTRRRVRAWEEAPLLDEIAVNAGYRATVVNLGLVQVAYDRLEEYVEKCGAPLCDKLKINQNHLAYICRCLLDEMRVRGCLSREMLRYHPAHALCPDYVRAAQWERRVKQPKGYALASGQHPAPLAFMENAAVPMGITVNNFWRRPKGGGKGPSFERMLRHLLAQFGGIEPKVEDALALVGFLMKPGRYLVASELFGARDKTPLLQVSEECLRLKLVREGERMRCQVCGTVLAGAKPGLPCPYCHGKLEIWLDSDVLANRTARRIKTEEIIPLVAREHTAQVPNTERQEFEDDFKAGAEKSKVNVLACSPTLEMGIDVGGLDAVVLRNIPPRPDNYAQRGGRAGRRSRVGLVLGYARSTPHDQYFYDKPTEMISGEVPAPALALGNRDVIVRHLYSIVFGAADPGLAGKMVEYVSPQGVANTAAVEQLTNAVMAQCDAAVVLALSAWGQDVLAEAKIDEVALREALASLPTKIQEVVDRTCLQVQQMRQALNQYAAELRDPQAGVRAGNLVARILGIETKRKDADDRSAGYPLRRFAEFGILPGYEFPSEPAALRLLGDEHEDEPITTARRFGIDQFRPEAQVYARAKRWKVIGLDMASPWNPRIDGPGWEYRICSICGLKFGADHPSCPRCMSAEPGKPLPAAEYAGFLAKRDETTILDEEDRFAARSLVKIQPQWDSDVIGRWTLGPGWGLRLSHGEEVRWINEGVIPTDKEKGSGRPILHDGAKGYLVCNSCGRLLSMPDEQDTQVKGRRRPRSSGDQIDPFGHGQGCPQVGSPPKASAIACLQRTDVLRLLIPVPETPDMDRLQSWGLSLGYALHAGMRHLYMLDGSEVEFELEGPWKVKTTDTVYNQLSLTFIDPSIGGSGYLQRVAGDLHMVAQRAIEHLDHPNCETACYRCLKAYQNQRYHDKLAWPQIMKDLEELAANPSVERPLKTGDIQDPKPWLDAYAAGVGSPLELKFLHLFEQHGFYPEKQVPICLDGSGIPITVADFAVPERRLAIYIDGAAFHTGPNLRRDRYIRTRLASANPPWKVVELRAKDLLDEPSNWSFD